MPSELTYQPSEKDKKTIDLLDHIAKILNDDSKSYGVKIELVQYLIAEELSNLQDGTNKS